jgi:hypothetical protein
MEQNEKPIELQRCPNCGSELVKLNKSRSRVWYECDGDCWTQGDKCHTVEEAAKSWNTLKPTPKKTRFEALQESGIANFAVFLQIWQEKCGTNWSEMTEDEIINWLGEPVDPELEAILNF